MTARGDTPGRRARVLLLASQETRRATLRAVLVTRGFDVIAARDGVAAIRVLASGEPVEFVVLDVRGGVDMDELRLREALLHEPRLGGLPVIVVGDTDEEASAAAREGGVSIAVAEPLALRLVVGAATRLN